MSTPQVVWTKEKRQAIQSIVASTTPAPDAFPSILFRLAPGDKPLLDQAIAGSRDASRYFQVFTGPLAGIQSGLQEGSFVGDMIHRALNYFRIDIRYILARGGQDCLMDLNDMMDADESTISWRLNPDVSAALWGNSVPLIMRYSGNQVLGSPVEGMIPTNIQSIPVVLRLYYQIEHDIGERY